MIYRGFSVAKQGDGYIISRQEQGQQAPFIHSVIAADEEEAVAWIDVIRRKEREIK